MILAIKPQFYYFLSSFLNSLLLHNFNLSPPPPHSWIPSFSIWLFSLPILFYFPLPPQFFLFSLLNLAFPPPPQFLYFPPSILISRLLHNFIIFPPLPPPSHLNYIFFHPQIHRPHIDPASTLDSFSFFNAASWIVKLNTTTTTFLLFLLFTKLTFFDYFNRISNPNGGPINSHH